VRENEHNNINEAPEGVKFSPPAVEELNKQGRAGQG